MILSMQQGRSRPFMARAGFGFKEMFLLAVAVVCLGVAGYKFTQFWQQSGGSEVHYPYWCEQCKAVFDVSELKEDPGKWRIAPGGGSDSVVICLRCDEGKAYPAAQCSECGNYHLLHIWRDGSCPICNPEVAQAAQEQGIDLTPPELPSGD